MEGDNLEISVDFTGTDVVPVGDALLLVSKLEKKLSSKGNRMLNVQLKIIEADDPAFVGRIVFENWMLETDAVWRTKNALKAFLGAVPTGPHSFTPDELLGKQAWCSLEPEAGTGEYEGTTRSKVKKYGIKHE